MPRFDGGPTEGGTEVLRGVPARRIGGQLVTTVFDLLLAQYAVGRDGLPGEWPTGYDDPTQPGTPAWQQEHTGVDAGRVVRIAREFARNAEQTNGRSMIVIGAGVNHWYHADETYRAMLSLVLLCGCQGVNGGGWAHYVGQEKVRPISGWATVAFALDWARPPRQQPATPFWYLLSDQWRYESLDASDFTSPTGPGRIGAMHTADSPRARRAARLAAELSDVRSQPARHRRRGGGGRASRWPTTSSRSCRPDGSGSPARTPTRRRTTPAC